MTGKTIGGVAQETVIKQRPGPGGGVMAHFARMRIIHGHMIGAAWKISGMTRITIGRTSQHAVIKTSAAPRGGVMAIFTRVRKIHRHVVGRFLEFGLMTGITFDRRPMKIADVRARMALHALRGNVHSG